MSGNNPVEICDMWQLSELSYKRGFDTGFDACRIVLAIMAEQETKDGGHYTAVRAVDVKQGPTRGR